MCLSSSPHFCISIQVVDPGTWVIGESTLNGICPWKGTIFIGRQWCAPWGHGVYRGQSFFIRVQCNEFVKAFTTPCSAVKNFCNMGGVTSKESTNKRWITKVSEPKHIKNGYRPDQRSRVDSNPPPLFCIISSLLILLIYGSSGSQINKEISS